MTEKHLHIHNEHEMQAFGARLAQAAPARWVVYLVGDLGAGKTTLVRGYLRALGHVGAVKSPTYTLVEPYDLEQARVYHLDLYRVRDPEEVEYLGLRDMLEGQVSVLVEWPQCGIGYLPPADLEVIIEHAGDGRELTLRAHSPCADAVLAQI